MIVSLRKAIPETPFLHEHPEHISFNHFPLLAFNGSYSKLFVDKVERAVEGCGNAKGLDAKLKLSHMFSPSILRKALFLLFLDMHQAKTSHAKRRRIGSVFHAMLNDRCKERDVFAKSGNYEMNEKEAKELVGNVRWSDNINLKKGRDFNNLMAAGKAFSEALYTPYFSEIGFENFGPYDVSEEFEKGSQMMVTRFGNFNPVGLWEDDAARTGLGKDEMARAETPAGEPKKIRNMLLIAIYKDAKINLDFFNGIKSRKGTALTHFSVIVDSKIMHSSEVEQMVENLREMAYEPHRRISQMRSDALKRKMLEIRSYALKPLFDFAKMDWKPSEKMLKTAMRQIPKKFDEKEELKMLMTKELHEMVRT